MEKERRRLVLHVTPAIFFISLFLLLSDFYDYNEFKFTQWVQVNSRASIKRFMVNITIDDEHVSNLSPQEVNISIESIDDEIVSKSSSTGKNQTANEISDDGKTIKNSSREQNSSSKKVKQQIVGSQEINEVVHDHKSQLIMEGETIKTDDQKLWIDDEGIERTDKKERLISNKEGNETVNQESQLLTIEQHAIKQSPFSRLVRGEDRKELEDTGFACDRTASSLVCLSDKNVQINTNSMMVYVPYNQNTSKINKTEVRPYQRQDDHDLLQWITPVQFLQGNTPPPCCQYTHNEPAVIFSSGGFTGNLFHEFNEIIIPLFITTQHFKSRIQYIVVDYKQSFVNKYSKILSRLSSYKVMNPDEEKGEHCFPGVIAGLKFHDHLALNSREIPGGYSMPDFRQFLKKTYSLKVENVSYIKKPVLMLISRTTTRRFLNEGEMVSMMKTLGFEVIVVKKPERMSNLSKFSRLVNRCSVLVGTHGAGLANELFLPDGAVMIQVEPLGLEWASSFYFGNPAAAMGVHYLRYKIEPEESSLLEKYGRNHPVITDPASVFAKGYQAARAAYIDQQSMIVNISRFSETLAQALTLVGHSSP
ncbi:hypothetical protein Leryth_005079 [Lithospermum erythrorhizon]|nr:hypothetical protein Leryth_005079 [Lithospermum erythrorhizon]